MDEDGCLCSELRAVPLLACREIEETQRSDWVKKRSDKDRSDRDADSAAKPNGEDGVRSLELDRKKEGKESTHTQPID